MRNIISTAFVLSCTLFTILFAQNKMSVAIIGESSSCNGLGKTVAATAETVVAQNQRFYAIKPEVYRHILGELDRQKDPNYIYSTTFAEQFKAVGAQYILYTDVIGCGAEDVKNKEGKFLGYRGWVEISASIVDLAKTTSVYSTKFKTTGSTLGDRAAAQANAAGSNSIKGEIEKLLKNAFPFEISIVEITKSNKDKADEMLISGGSELGIQEGDFFEVIVLDERNGVPFEISIGRVKVKQLNGAKMSTAKPAKGDKEILAAFNESKRIVLRSSDRKAWLDQIITN